MAINKERLWQALGEGDGTYVMIMCHDTVDIVDAEEGGSEVFKKLNTEKDLLEQVCDIALSINGDTEEYGDDAASRARIVSISSSGKLFPKEKEITVEFQPETIQFGHVIPKEGEYIGDSRSPKKGASLDERWVCMTRCGIRQHIMEHDIVIASARTVFQHAPLEGEIIYKDGVVTPKWLNVMPKPAGENLIPL